MTFAWEQYCHCPRCGAEYEAEDLHVPTTSFRCRSCGYEFFQNSSPACTAVVPSKSRPREIILLTRTAAPGAGQLALPGGFLQFHEPPFEAVTREVREEIHVEVDVARLLDTYLVDYSFRGAMISVVEIVFLCRPLDVDVSTIFTEEAASVRYFDVGEILKSPLLLAFPEQRQALNRYYDAISACDYAIQH